MTKQQLEFFLSAAEFSNLSKAAAFHYVSIPTFTRHINDLEEELSTRLFTRTNRGVNLTEAGALFHPIARQTLESMYDYYDLILEKGLLEGEPTERFVMGYYPFGGMFAKYASLKDRYLEMWLKMPCNLRCMNSGTMTEMVKNGKLDVGAVSKAQVEKYGDLFESRLLFRASCVLLVDKNHELAGRDNISIKELSEKYGDFSLYLPVESTLPEFENKKIRDQRDIRSICRHFLDIIPELTAQAQEKKPSGKVGRMIIVTDFLQRPELNEKHRVNIENGHVPLEVRLFWRKDNNSEKIKRFKAALDFAEIQ